MDKQIKYYVKHDVTGRILGSNGVFVSSIGDEKVQSFDAEATAKAAIPQGQKCSILRIARPVRQERPQQESDATNKA